MICPVYCLEHAGLPARWIVSHPMRARWWTSSGGPTTRSPEEAFCSATWEAARCVRERAVGSPNASSAERLCWAASAYRASRMGHCGVLSMRRSLVPVSEDWPDVLAVPLLVWADEVRVAARADLRVTVGEAVALARRAALWRNKPRQALGLTTCDAGGKPVDDLDAVEEILRRHWNGVFAARRTCPVARAELLHRLAPVFLEDLPRRLARDDFVALLATPPAVAPGPDGLP